VNIIPLHQEVRGIFVIKAAVEMQNNLPLPVIITNSINKTVLLLFCDNKCD
jgi:hypothetical protein